jgi:hypothetical protein
MVTIFNQDSLLNGDSSADEVFAAPSTFNFEPTESSGRKESLGVKKFLTNIYQSLFDPSAFATDLKVQAPGWHYKLCSIVKLSTKYQRPVC